MTIIETPIWDDMLADGYADEHAHALELKDKIEQARTWEPTKETSDDGGRVDAEESPVHETDMGGRADGEPGGADADDAADGVPSGRGDRSGRTSTTTSSARRKGTPRRTRSKPVGQTGGDGAASASGPAVHPPAP